MLTYRRFPVKSDRRTIRPAGRFGAGVLATHPSAGRMPYTAADLIAVAEMFDRDRARPAGPDWDAMARESEWQDRMAAGFAGWEL